MTTSARQPSSKGSWARALEPKIVDFATIPDGEASSIVACVSTDRERRVTPRTSDETTERERPTPIPWGAIAVTGATITSLLVAAIVVVLGPADLSADKSLRLDAFKVALAGLAGYGAAVTVWLGLRRQQHAERDAWNHRQFELSKQESDDAANRDRRALELYSAATEQLASHQAAVRLAGLYSFERLAAENSFYRQNVADVFCSYLRISRSFDTEPEELAEGEVRQAVQSLLVRHLRRPETESAWEGIRIRLDMAHLRDFDATHAWLNDASFSGAHFEGSTKFDRATFRKRARFEGCTFDGKTSFRECRFESGAIFDRSEFCGEEIAFTGARFEGSSSTAFRSCIFAAKQVIFRGARFTSMMSTNFSRATFGGSATFKRTTFASRITSFNRASFDDGVEPFVKAKLTQVVLVSDPTFWASIFRGAHLALPLQRPTKGSPHAND